MLSGAYALATAFAQCNASKLFFLLFLGGGIRTIDGELLVRSLE